MKFFLGLILIILIVGGIFWFWRNKSVVPEETNPLVIELSAERPGEDTGIFGQALIEEIDGQAKISIRLDDSPLDTPLSAYLQRGRCAVLGEPIYTLKPIVNSVSETTLTVTLAGLTNNLPLAVAVYLDETGVTGQMSNSAAACGEIILK